MYYFCVFLEKDLTNHALIFLRVWTKNANCWKILKIFDENSIEKCYFYFGKFGTKNRAFGNNTIFLQHFFSVGGFPTPLLATPLTHSDSKFSKSA